MATIELYAVGQTIDQYKVVRLIANTQNSHTYLVEASGLHKQLVLKYFAGELSLSAVKQFVDQANLLLEFSQHPHIANLMHLGSINERPFIIMPYYPQTLNDLLAVHYQKLSFLPSLGIIKQVLSATQSLHHLGVVHADIKPQNIYLDESNNAALADFDNALILNSSPLFDRFHGLTKSFEENCNEGRGFTPEYATPEQINHLSQSTLIDESGDLYSIGALWLRMLVGDTLAHMMPGDTSADGKAFIHQQLKDIAPNWATQLISELLHTSALNRPSCCSCLAQIDHHVQVPHDNPTVQADSIPMSVSASKLQEDIKQILLHDGWVCESERIRLLATYQMFDNQNKHKNSDDDQQPSHELLLLIIDECERQLIQDMQLSRWFSWVKYIQALAVSLGAKISAQEYEKALELGRKARPDKPQLVEALLKKHFIVKTKTLNLATRYLVPAVIILCVFFYWVLMGQNAPRSSADKSNSTMFIKEVSANNNDVKHAMPDTSLHEASQTTVNEITNRTTALSQTPSFDPGKINNQAGTYEFQFESGNQISLINVNWISLVALPSIRIMTTELTNSLYSLCVKEGACRHAKQYSTRSHQKRNKWFDYSTENSQNSRATYPKVNLSWYEITEQFIPWINQRTGKQFNLPSFSQWKIFSQSAANSKDKGQIVHCRDCVHSSVKQFMNGTMPVAAISADSFGLHHVFGNVQEWLQDCWQQQSTDGQFVQRCDQAMVVGGSWLSKSSDWDKVYVSQLLKTAKTPTTGFRLVELVDE